MALTEADFADEPLFQAFTRGGAGTLNGGYFQSNWRFGLLPAPLPAAGGESYDSTHASAPPIPKVDTGETLYLVRLDTHATNSTSPVEMMSMVADRLVGNSGLSTIVTTPQAVTLPALPARAGTGVGVQGFLEIHVATGATASVVTVSYTNSSGVAGRVTTVPWPGTGRIYTCVPIPLVNGDLGIQSVQSVTWSVSSGTAGSVGVTLVKPVTVFTRQVPAGQITRLGPVALVAPVVHPDACLQTFTWAAGGSYDSVVMHFVVK